MKPSVLFLALGVAFAGGVASVHASSGAQPASAGPAAGAESAIRADLAAAIVGKWAGHVEAAYARPADAWTEEMMPLLASVPLDRLQSAATARSFEDMNDVLLGKAGDGTLALGDANADLVYVPVTPCRLLDTRVAGGVIAANTTRGFDVASVANYSAQGGSASNCGVGNVAGISAAVVNFTVVTPNAAGYVTAFPAGGSQPLAATVNYTAGDVRGNQTIVPLDADPAGSDVSVYTFAQTHLVADVVGYFLPPQATGLQCSETFAIQSVPANGSFDIQLPSCPTGYRVTGAGCRTPGFNQANWAINGLFRASPGVLAAFCSGTNTTNGTISVEGTAQCCRVPGR
ncbi:hypothetical protein [Arenimonas sp.]|uniref:hypothetical protein n=1 Tax=Arenimonas sp. TaxID=1872635 RepID=UPI002E30D683|nr:hypothetical protein [Arenimonas sp.]HEX4853382.1 hypothetical protein [Arenimonas sp.]